MAAPISMDEGGELGKNKSLAVNKSSSKIKKGLRPTLTQPRLAPQVYKTEPSDFRSLVQQLTGTSQPASNPSPKPPNSRLQRIAPPPLRPMAAAPAAPTTVAPTGNPFPFGTFSPSLKHALSPFGVSPLSFSPLPQLSPGDAGWVNSLTGGGGGLESPASALNRQVAEKIAQQGETSKEPAAAPTSPTFSNLRFSGFSPTGFPSPNTFNGFGLSNVYGLSGSFTPSAALAMDATFSFPEPDIAMSPATTP